MHDFPGDAIGKAIPYGVYGMARNEAWVNVGRDHDTPQFAVASIRQWWKMIGSRAYPDAKQLFITADAGGSNGYCSLAWKHELQKFADDLRLKHPGESLSTGDEQNGTRSSIASSVTSRRTGGASPCERSRPSSI